MKYPQFERAIQQIRDSGIDIDSDYKIMPGGKGGTINLRISGATYNFFHSPWNDFGLHFVYQMQKNGKLKFQKICDFHRTPNKIIELIIMIYNYQKSNDLESDAMDSKSELVINEERSKVCEMMEQFGGGFASPLGIALGRADHENMIKIYNAWPDLWEQYLHMWHQRNDKK